MGGKQQFDALGDAYDESAEEMALRRWLEQPSVREALGDVSSRSVIDVGCGSGVYTRLVRRMGADPVVGIDIAEGMIETASATEHRDPLGIQYEVADVSEAGSFGQFDIVLGVYVLPYARSVQHLREMCTGMVKATTESGRILTLTLNPDFSADVEWYEKYGFTLHQLEPRGEGSAVQLTASFGRSTFSVDCHFYTKQLIDRIFGDLGFTTRWSSMATTAPSLAAADRAFLERYLEVPHALILECTR